MDDEPSNTKLLNAVGMALALWSAVEMHLCALFRTISDMKSKDRASAMFDSIINFEIRLVIISNLMETEDVDPVEAEMWRRLSRKLAASYKKRHEVAHFSIRMRGGEPHAAPFLTHTRLWVTGETLLGADEIEERARKFTLLARAITWFNIRAVHRRTPADKDQPAAPVEEPFVLQLRELAIQSLAKQPPRDQSDPD